MRRAHGPRANPAFTGRSQAVHPHVTGGWKRAHFNAVMTTIRRRDLLAGGAAAAGILALGPSFWRGALAAPAVVGDSPYGPLQPPDANGLMLPPGFRSRELARGGQAVAGTDYVWHVASDGMATYAQPDGSWVLVSNSETISL